MCIGNNRYSAPNITYHEWYQNNELQHLEKVGLYFFYVRTSCNQKKHKGKNGYLLPNSLDFYKHENLDNLNSYATLHFQVERQYE